MPTTTPPLAPASAPTSPTWLDAWIASPVVLDSMRERAASWPAEVKAALVRYPFDCVVRCTCGGKSCLARHTIILGAAMKHSERGCGVILYARTEPEGPIFELIYGAHPLNVVAYRGGLDSPTMAALLRPSAGQA